MTAPDRFAAAEALAGAGRLEESRAAFEAALAAGPDDAAARTRLGMLCRTLDDLEGALAAFEQVMAALPGEEAPRLNLAATLDEAGDFERALDLANRAPELLASSPEARWLAAPVFMHAGDFERGLECLEARWQTGHPAHAPRAYAQPLWRGEAGRGNLFVWPEQGLGDGLFALRFAARAAARGWSVHAETQPALGALLAGMRGVTAVIPSGGTPAFERHLPAMSLPWALGVRAADAGDDLPALVAPPERLARWRERMAPTQKMRVGLAWRSTIVRDNPEVVRNKLGKSIPLASLAPLAAIPGVEWVSLQVGEGMDEAARVPALKLTDLTAHIDDLADTAALMAHLDLVVSIDTVTAHLAGCLGVPLIVLGMQVPDWRWHVAGGGSPWYPAARVFRQRRRHDWRDAVTQAGDAIRALAATRRPAGALTRAARWLKGR